MYGLLGLDNIRYNYLNIWNLRVQKKIKILRKSPLKLSKWSVYIFTVRNLQNIFMEHDL